MRILVAPDKFAGTLSAVEAAEAIATGWRRQAPDDEIDLAPMSDGGPGFVDVLNAALGGELLVTTVYDPFDREVPATLLVVEDTAYVESAQACGIHLTGTEQGGRGHTFGVGQLLDKALRVGVRRVVVGLGGSGTSDAGAGMLAALGASADVPLSGGGDGLSGATTVDLTAARRAVEGIELVAASDVDNPLTGLFGSAKTFGPQKGLSEDDIVRIDGCLEQFAAATDRRLALEKGAGAAGGLGFGLMLLGARRQSGIELVAGAVRLAERARTADIVITGEGAFDFSSRAGKVPAGVAAIAADALRPCVALAGQVLVGSREMRALGMDSAYSLVDLVGEERALGDPAGSLAALAQRVARTWSS
jgi:glycerate kinase